ncbi:tryptophan 7-halogenase [Sphingomonas sp. CFBP 13714]|uniref:tryptophan halogenase family protein n=1 Tax=Sphingomonas sp. CFBP 13714 TaxID=2775308 RepID=UPI00177E6E50|nr:tryptophan halogenase family protein [Sphingomonas sp. CFBP 13714]MBD8699894.1 tryptophan 7-halogenase [Sphingomonas sp. CFBP 13714]
MDTPPKTRVIIAGGGTAGWLAAALLTRQLGALVDVTLIESDEIGTVGVGEATIPTVQAFHALLGFDERAFMAATGATFKLGIAFEGWARPDDRYVHSFGDVGRSTWMGDFQHFWLEARANGLAGDFGDYCLELQAAEARRFTIGQQGPQLNYAYHFDAGRYARFLRERCETAGLTRIEGRIAGVDRSAETGHIDAVILANGSRVAGDLFLDCSGFRGLLIGDALGVGYEDWSHWLPANRALAVQTSSVEPARPYTRAIAHDAGWQWRIPLQHRVGNGIVYSSEYLSDDAAQDRLLASVQGRPLTDPRLLRFTTGRRLRAWEGNCIALSLAGGFVEPLESTSIHLVMTALTRLLRAFPFDGISPAVVAQFNAQTRREIEGVRDFVILHYHLNQRSEPFWKACAAMPIPDTLAERIALFSDAAQAYQSPDDLFRVSSWTQVMLGQRLEPRDWHRLARMMPTERLGSSLAELKAGIAQQVDRLPAHQAFVDRYCAQDAPGVAA